MNLRRTFRAPVFLVVLAILVVFGLLEVATSGSGYKTVPLPRIQAAIDAGQVTNANLLDKEQEIQVTLSSGHSIEGQTKVESAFTHDYDVTLANELRAGGVNYTPKVDHSNVFVTLLENVLPFVLILAVMFFFLNQMQGGGGRVMQFGKARAKLVSKDTPKTTFADVAGADEAIEELQEIKEFLENPAKFQAIGAKIPKGVLLYGPPGTGKTLLARAVAGEAGVPFYSISGDRKSVV